MPRMRILSAAVAVGNPRGLEHADKAEQEIAESCNRLIRNCIVCRKYLYMTRQFEAATTPDERDRILRMMAIHSPHRIFVGLKPDIRDFADDGAPGETRPFQKLEGDPVQLGQKRRPVQAAASTVITRRFPNRARASSSLPILVACRGSSMRRTSLSWTPRATAKALLDSRCSRRAS